MTLISTHLAQDLFPVLPPQNDSYHSQQQQYDAHQAANQNGCITAVILGYRKPRLESHSSKFWEWKRKMQDKVFVCVQICISLMFFESSLLCLCVRVVLFEHMLAQVNALFSML